MDELETRPLGKPAKDTLVHFLPVKRSVERAFVGLAIVAAVIGGVGQREASAGVKMYWTDLGIDKIQRANLDGAGVEDLVTKGLSAPWGIALDVTGRRMYWTDAGTGKIQRAKLDGTGVQDLITTGLTHPGEIALDVSGGKMYWTDSATGKIQWANLDGTSVEDLIITNSSGPMGGRPHHHIFEWSHGRRGATFRYRTRDGKVNFFNGLTPSREKHILLAQECPAEET